MIVVGNASPIMNLATVEQANLLGQLYGEIFFPDAVFQELTVIGCARPHSAILQTLSRVTARSVANRSSVDSPLLELDAGEAEAIVLAVEIGADLLLLDERRGRTVAGRLGVKHIGILGVLVEAKRKDLLPAVKPVLDELNVRSAGYSSPARGGEKPVPRAAGGYAAPPGSGGRAPGEPIVSGPRKANSCHLFFLSPSYPCCSFGTETVEPDQDGVERRFEGEGRVGHTVAISLAASFALVALNQYETFENGRRSEPGSELPLFDLDGKRLDAERHYLELFGEESMRILAEQRDRIARVLEEHGLSVLPDEYLETPLPRLRAGEDVLQGSTGKLFSVRDAFFFETA